LGAPPTNKKKYFTRPSPPFFGGEAAVFYLKNYRSIDQMKPLEILFFVICALATVAGIVSAIKAHKMLNTCKAESVKS
jgi:hypothetical protein